MVGPGPKDGKAVKEIFFTSKPGVLYAIVAAWPGDELVVRDVKPAADVKVSMLGRNEPLSWRSEADKMVIDLSGIGRNELPCKWAWTFRIEGNIGQ